MNQAPVVLKFGGTSVGTPERMRAVARTVSDYRERNPRVVVVVSAMGQSTDELIELALKVSPRAREPSYRREMDMLLTTGERVSMALLSMALSDLGVEAVSFTGSQSGIITDTVHGEARIADIRPMRIRESLDRGKVVIVAGFQGVSAEKEITTLGRGGSDTTAVALAACLDAREAVIFTDVPGFFTADPRRVFGARKLARVGWDTALRAAHFGAQVLHPRCVEVAWRRNLPIELRSSFSAEEGTRVEGVDAMSMEGSQVFTVAVQKGLLECSVPVADMGLEEELQEMLRKGGAKPCSWRRSGETLVAVWENEGPGVHAADAWAKRTKVSRRDLSRVTLIGCGLLTPEIAAAVRSALARASLNVLDVDYQPTSVAISLAGDGGADALAGALHAALVEKA